MFAKAGQSISFRFPAHNAAGSAEDATSGPNGTLVTNGVDDVATITITDVGDGDYRFQGTFPGDLVPGDLCQWRVDGTVDGETPIWFSPIFQITDLYPWELSTFDADNDVVDANILTVEDTDATDYFAALVAPLSTALSTLATAVAAIPADVDTQLDDEFAAVTAALSALSTAVAGVPAAVDTQLDDEFAALTASLAALSTAVAAIPADVDDELQDDFAGVGGGGGGGEPGGVPCTLTFLDSDTDPIQDMRVWITSDEDGSTLIDGAYRTDSAGQVTFNLLDGETYYYWTNKAGKQATTGSFVAEED